MNDEPLLADPEPTTPSGGSNYQGMSPADLLAFKTADLTTLAGVQLTPGVYQVLSWKGCWWHGLLVSHDIARPDSAPVNNGPLRRLHPLSCPPRRSLCSPTTLRRLRSSAGAWSRTSLSWPRWASQVSGVAECGATLAAPRESPLHGSEPSSWSAATVAALLTPGAVTLAKCSTPYTAASPTTAGIPAAITATTGLRKLKVQFSVPNPDAAVYYEYSMRDASNLVRGGQRQVQSASGWTIAWLLCRTGPSCSSQTRRHSLFNWSTTPSSTLWQAVSSHHRCVSSHCYLQASVPSANRIQVPRSAVTVANGKVSFETVELLTYKYYQLRVTAVGYGSVYSQWTASAVAGERTSEVVDGLDSLTMFRCVQAARALHWCLTAVLRAPPHVQASRRSPRWLP